MRFHVNQVRLRSIGALFTRDTPLIHINLNVAVSKWVSKPLLVMLMAGTVLLTFPVAPTQAAIRILPFSAMLKSATTSAAVPDGNYSVTFRLYIEASGGTALWTETQTITVTDGALSANLGEVTAIPASITFNDDSYYLGVQVGDDPEMSPRRRIGAVPAAFNADTVDGYTTGTGANNILLLDENGNINIQGSGTIAGGLTIGTSLLPSADASIALGSSSAQFSTLYVGNIISGAATLTLPSTTDTLVGRATTDTLTNKTLTAPTIQGVVSAGSGLTLPAFTASGNITGSGSPTLSGFGTINGTTLAGSSLSSTALQFSGATGTISVGTTNGSLTVNANGSGTIAIGSTGTGDITLAGGSADTGCTISNATGALTCSATINSANLSATSVNGLGVASGVVTSGTWNGNAIGSGYGGTGITTYTAGDLLYAPSTNTLGKLTAGEANEGKILKVQGGLPTWVNEAASGGDITSVTAGTGLQGGGLSGDIEISLDTANAIDWTTNGAASTPAQLLSGTWYTGGTSTTTKPQFLIEPSGTTSTAWSTSGTAIGVNGATGFSGNLVDLQVAGSSKFAVDGSGNMTITGNISVNSGNFSVAGATGNTTVGGTLGVAGNTTLTGDLIANGNTTLGNASTDTITFNGVIASHLVPETTATYDLGSESVKFRKIYAQEVIYDTSTNISTTGDSITINSDATDDENSYLEYYRGEALTSAKILWDATNDRFDFNYDVLLQGSATLGNANTDTTTVRGTLTLSDSSSTYALLFGADTNLYRSAANTLKTDDALVVTGNLTVASNNINGATVTGGTLSGGTLSGSTLSATALTFSGASGTIALDTTDANLTINANGAGTIAIGNSSTGNITLGGGSGSTGCTLTNSTGAFACTSTINGATISGGTLSGGSVSGGTISGGTITGGTLSATQVNGLQVDSDGLITGSATWNGNRIGAAYGGTGIDTSGATGIAVVSSGTWEIAASIGATQGGTGQTSVTTGDLLYGSGANTWGKLSAVASGSMLVSNGVGAAPSWSSSPTLSTSLTVPLIQTSGANLQLQASTGITAFNESGVDNILRVYGDDGTDYLELKHDASNAIITASNGELQLGGTGSSDFLLGDTGSAVNLVFEESSTISGQGANTITVGVSGDTFNFNTSGTTYNFNTLTQTSGITIAAGSGASTSATQLKVNGPSSFSGNLLDLQVNGSSKLSINQDGDLTGVDGTFSGVLTVDTNTLYVDATNNRVGIGTTSPSNALHVLSTSTPQARFAYDSSNYLTVLVGSTGSVTLDTNGSAQAFAISDALTASSTLTVTSTFTANGGVTLGDGGDAIAINSSDWDISTTGELTGITGITNDGAYTQSGTGANTLSGATSFTASGTALSVTNNATISGTLTSGGINLASATLQGTTATIDFTNFDVSSAGALTVASTINGATLSGGTLSGGSVSGGSLSATAVNGLSVSSGTISSGTWQGTAVALGYGGTGQSSYTNGDLLYYNSSSSTTALTKLGIGSNGQCLIVSSNLPAWGSCGSTTLQSAYDAGKTISTTDAGHITITLTNQTTDPNFVINIASSSSSKFAIQSNGTDMFKVDSTGTTIGDSSNYTKFDTAGGLTFSGTARPTGEILLLPGDETLPASSGCASASVDGSGSPAVTYKTVDCGSGESAFWQFKMPTNYASGQTIHVDVYWVNGTASGSATFDAAYVAVPGNGAWHSASLTNQTGSSVANSVANAINTSTIQISSPSINANEVVNLRLRVSGISLTGDARIIQARVRFPAGS